MTGSDPDRSLAGRRYVVTRPRRQAGSLIEGLLAHGASVFEFPTVRVGDPLEAGPLEQACREIASYDGVVLTSANAAERLRIALRQSGASSEAVLRPRWAAVGPGTVAALGSLAEGALVADRHDAEGLFRALAAQMDLAGRRFLFPRADRARRFLPEALREAGATVEEVVVYRLAPEASAPVEALRRELAEDRIDAVTFFSGSAVRFYVELLGGGALTMSPAIVTIGPTTSNVVRELGGRVDREACPHTVSGLIEALGSGTR